MWKKEKMLVISILSFFQNVFQYILLNPFPNEKILDTIKLKAFADDKLNIAKMTISPLNRAENTVGK